MYIGKGTRFFKLDLVAYCSNTGQFAMLELKVDMRISGALVPKAQVFCRRYAFYQTTSDWFRLALEVLLILFWLGYMADTIRNIRTMAVHTGRRLAFFGVMWNMVDLAHFTLLGVSIGTWIYIVADPVVQKLDITEDTISMGGMPVNFESTTTAVEFYFSVNGVNMLIGLLRIMKFLRMNAYLGQLTDALEMMKEGMAQFFIVLVLVIVVFTFLGMMLFGAQLEMFADPVSAIDRVIGYTVGSSDASDLLEVNVASCLIFYVPFIFIVLFFVLPLTIAIIMDGYSEMQVVCMHACMHACVYVFCMCLCTYDYPEIQVATLPSLVLSLSVSPHHFHPSLHHPSHKPLISLPYPRPCQSVLMCGVATVVA